MNKSRNSTPAPQTPLKTTPQQISSIPQTKNDLLLTDESKDVSKCSNSRVNLLRSKNVVAADLSTNLRKRTNNLIKFNNPDNNNIVKMPTLLQSELLLSSAAPSSSSHIQHDNNNKISAKLAHRNQLTNSLDIYQRDNYSRLNDHNFRKRPTISSNGIVFNGTYPIDDPVSSRFHNEYIYNEYDEDNYEEDDDDDQEDDNDDDDEDDDDNDGDYDDQDLYAYNNLKGNVAEYNNSSQVENKNKTVNYEDNVKGYSIDELVHNKKIKINFDKMKAEYDRSFKAFDEIIDKNRRKNVRTFNIDAPI